MTYSNRRCCINFPNCNCGEPDPYYTDPCFQKCQPHDETVVLAQYTPVIKIINQWAVPEADVVLTLDVPAVVDMLIGSSLWNPDYGGYVVVSFNKDFNQVGLTKELNNEAIVGTPIPACTKFIVIKPDAEDSPDDPGYFVKSFTETEGNPAGSSLDDVYNFVLPGNTLNVNGASLEFFIAGEFQVTNVADTKELEINFGSLNIPVFSDNTMDVPSFSVYFTVRGRVVRLTSTTQFIVYEVIFNTSTSGGALVYTMVQVAGSENLLANVDVDVSIAGVNEDDIELHYAKFYYLAGSG